MRCITLLVVIAASFFTVSSEARRWRFAVPFPGGIEPSFPNQRTNKALLVDVDKQEKIFDTKEVSRHEHKPKVVVGDDTVKKGKKTKTKKSGIFSRPPPDEEEHHELSPIEIIDSTHMPWIL